VKTIKPSAKSNPQGQWIFIADELNIHKSALLVMLIVEQCGIQDDLGEISVVVQLSTIK
jgi:hypothetical protein